MFWNNKCPLQDNGGVFTLVMQFWLPVVGDWSERCAACWDAIQAPSASHEQEISSPPAPLRLP